MSLHRKDPTPAEVDVAGGNGCDVGQILLVDSPAGRSLPAVDAPLHCMGVHAITMLVSSASDPEIAACSPWLRPRLAVIGRIMIVRCSWWTDSP